MPFGAELLPRGGVVYRLWAPDQQEVVLERFGADGRLREARVLRPDDAGWVRHEAPDAGPGERYRYRVPRAPGAPAADGLAVPDPASRSNPDGVHGPSEVVDPNAFVWQHDGWTGRPWHEAVLYELHVGSFTPEGSFRAAARKLPALAALGITAVELMPLASFGGRRGWGYDGVLPFAPAACYGPPDDLRHFVDRAHGLGLMVLLDVVYNHFGPDGNYLHAHCRSFFDAARRTPWGDALNVDGPRSATVRRFFVDNALHWLTEYRMDGLRLDAVHAIEDRSARHLVDEIAEALHRGPGRHRHVHLVLENDDNRADWLQRDAAGSPRLATAQWNDDWHHAAHVLATGETAGYYADYAADPAADLARALAGGFVYQGQPSAHRGGKPRGEPSAGLPPVAFVNFLQNHDQVGNRAFGERLDAVAPAVRVEALLTALLLAPAVPMLFMGEEFAASTPFPYFCEFDGALGRAVSDGRRAEFAGFDAFADPARRAALPDPNDPATFEAARLRWEETETPAGQRRQALVAGLLRLRREHLQPVLPQLRSGGQARPLGPRAWCVDWPLGAAGTWRILLNFGPGAVPRPAVPGERLLHVGGTPAGADGLAPEQVQVLWLPPTAPVPKAAATGAAADACALPPT